jgi:hypothetical protein
MAAADTYPPRTEDKRLVMRPFITKNRIGLKRAVFQFLRAQAAPIAKDLADSLSLAKAADDGDAAKKAKAAIDKLDLNWSALADTTEPYLVAVAVAGGDAAAKGLDVDLADDFGAGMRERATEWASQRAAEMVGMKVVDGELKPNPNAFWRIDQTTRTLIQANVTAAIENGDSTQQLANRLQNAFAFSSERAEMIARTEIAKADVAGALIGWKETGLVIGKNWLTDGNPCPVCQSHEDDGPVPLDFVWEDGVVGPPDHPHCECVLTTVLEGEHVNQ